MDILGISCFFHDAAAALIRDGEIIAAAEAERFTRKKHDYDFPVNAIEFCLNMGKIRSEDLDYVVFFEKPFTKFERLLLTSMQAFPKSRKVFQESMLTWLTDKLWIKGLIKKSLNATDSKILFSNHHLSHAASAFFCSPFDEAAILTIDGVGEWATATYGIGKDRQITLKREIRFPHSLGLLYSDAGACEFRTVVVKTIRIVTREGGSSNWKDLCELDGRWFEIRSREIFCGE